MEKKRIITVPKDKIAEKLLYYDKASEDQLIDYYLNEEDSNYLFLNGYIDLINEVGFTNIEDYEDDAEITDPIYLKAVYNSLIEKIQNVPEAKRKLFEDLINLFKEAIDRKTGIYFYF